MKRLIGYLVILFFFTSFVPPSYADEGVSGKDNHISVNLGIGSTNNGPLPSYEAEYEWSDKMDKGRWVLTGLQLDYKKDNWKFKGSGIGVGMRGNLKISGSNIFHGTIGLNALYADNENIIDGVKITDRDVIIGPRVSLGYRLLLKNFSLNIGGDVDFYVSGYNVLNKSPLYGNSILPIGKIGIGYMW